MILFPASPVLNEIYTDPTGNRWQWDGFGWNNLGRELIIKHEDTTERDALNSHTAKAISLEDTNLGELTIETFSEAYQLTATDTNKIKRCTSAVDLNVTIPLDLALPMPVGIEQVGNGVVTVMAGNIGVTINGDVKTAGQYKMLVIMKVAANTYTIIGGTS
jgi:hypothetical protein